MSERSHIESKTTESLESVRHSLRHIIDVATSISELQEDKSPDQSTKLWIKENISFLETQFSYIDQGLQNEKLDPHAISALRACIAINDSVFKRKVSQYVEEHADSFAKLLQNSAEYSDEVIDLLASAYVEELRGTFLKDLTGESLYGGENIRKAIVDSLEQIKELFRDIENVPLNKNRQLVRLLSMPLITLILGKEYDANTHSFSPRIKELLYIFVNFLGEFIASKHYNPYTQRIVKVENAHASKRLLRTSVRNKEKYENAHIGETNIRHLLELFHEIPVRSFMFKELFAHFGLRITDYLDLHTRRKEEFKYQLTKELEIFVFNELQMIHLLEVERPGIVSTLRLKFGITWLNRYPKDVLIRQYDQKDSQKPYGIIVSARTDWNNSLMSQHAKSLVERLAREFTEKGYEFRIIEAGSENEFITHMEQLDAAYGDQNKIGFMIVRGHADKTGFSMGRVAEDYDITVDSFNNPDFVGLKDTLAPGASLIFDGCGIGKKNGMAHKTSEAWETTVYAPHGFESALEEIDIRVEKNRVTLSPFYTVFRTIKKEGKTGLEEKTDMKEKEALLPAHAYIKGHKK